MPPKGAPIVTPFLSSLISSSTYQSVPTANELESIRGILYAKQQSVANELERSIKRQKKNNKIGNGSGGSIGGEDEAAALAANAQSGARLEAIERARNEGNAARKGSPSQKVKRERLSASPAPSHASSTGFKPPAPVVTYGQSQNKKKNKHKVLESDDERHRDRSTTIPSPPHTQSTSGLKLKLSSHPKSRPVDPSPAPSTAPSTSGAIDFSLPAQPSRPLVPHRPGVQKPPKPGPKKQADVDEDFSNTKAPNQVLFTTFWSSIEPYLREIREDDLAMLGFKADAPESYDIPAKGRHYTEIWDEEDGNPPGTTPRISVPNMRPPPGTSHFVPAAEMNEDALWEEGKGLGHLTERIVAAVVSDQEAARLHQEQVAGKPAEEGQREAVKLDIVDLEERMKRELRSVMLLGEHEEFDPTKKDDDEITSSLRQCQRLLLQQTSLNDARKARLAEVAKGRLAVAEYNSILEGIEKSLEASWAKRIKKHGLTPKKSSAGGSTRPPVPENMKKLVSIRQRWLDQVGHAVVQGQSKGLPTRSIYEGVGDDEEHDEKIVEDAIEVESGDEDMP